MKNNLSLIYATLVDALNTSAAGTTWAPGVQVVEEHKAGVDGHILWVAPAKTAPLLQPEELEQLQTRGLLAEQGVATSKRFGRTKKNAYGVLLAKLKHGVDAVERKASAVQVLTQRNKELERELRQCRETLGQSMQMDRFLEQLRSAFKVKNSPKSFDFRRLRPQKGQANAGVPTLMLSDWHKGEVVQGSRINYLNEYNLAICDERAERVFSTTMEVLFHHQSGMSYEGLVLSLGGDMFSGNIHEELRATNEKPIHECMLDLAETLASAIVRMADEFPGVYVPAVAGNHGRIDVKPTTKNAAVDNYDFLLYKIVEMLVKAKMGSKCNVDFDISPSLDLAYDVYSTRYLLTHGDQVNTSTNADDFWSSMKRVAARKQDRSAAGRARRFDYLTCGHFHKYGNADNVIVNGSLKGYCEYSYSRNYAYERPIQALWITHPEHGITSHIPIYGDEPIRDGHASAPPVTRSTGLVVKR